MGGASGELDAAGRQFHDEEEVVGDQSALGPDLNGREVDGAERLPVRLQEGLPRRLASPLIVGEENALSPGSLHQGADLGILQVDNVLLAVVDPAGEDEEEEMRGVEDE
jgi:hypothetical protein